MGRPLQAGEYENSINNRNDNVILGERTLKKSFLENLLVPPFKVDASSIVIELVPTYCKLKLYCFDFFALLHAQIRKIFKKIPLSKIKPSPAPT